MALRSARTVSDSGTLRGLSLLVLSVVTPSVRDFEKETSWPRRSMPGPRPLSAKRIKNVVGTLHKILTTAVQWDALDKLPEFPKIKTSEGAFDFYNVTEAALLVDAASDAEERALLRFSLHTGARAGESLALEWTDKGGVS